MKVWVHLCVVASVAGLLSLACPAHAIVPVVFGTSWDGPGTSLQEILDARYGVGAIDVQNDRIGAHAGDIDPWFWVDQRFSALMIREVAGNADRNVVGWYLEAGGGRPVIDHNGDGIVFDGLDGTGATAYITFDQPNTKFGFYLDPDGPNGTINAPQPEVFFTNRYFNDRGPDGSGALHAPFDGDVQALVFDVTALVADRYGDGQQTWLVCFEDLDSGAEPGPCCSTTDNDFNDCIFEVTAFGATPAAPLSFGALKSLYRR
jgi:hypothetical protein